MMRYIVIPGLVYSGESDEQAARREAAMLAHNRAVDEQAYRNGLPMAAYREWAARHGLIKEAA